MPTNSHTLIEELDGSLGPGLVRSGADIPQRNWQDAAGIDPHPPAILVMPRSTEQVARCLEICNRHGAAVVVQGGMTGLAGGAHPQGREVAISLERMSGIEEIDTISGTLTALAGTPLAEVQAAAAEAGFFCGIDLGARGSCTIGGNVSTNAGGNQVLRYGMARRNVLGLEVVLADGRVLTSLNKMLKNNAGYDWTQLFIGSEGTLGIVTRVVLGLHPKPRGVQSALCAFASFEDAITVLRRLDDALPGRLIVFEAMWREYMDVTCGPGGMARPFTDEPELVVLLEAAMGDAEGGADLFEETLGGFLEEGLLVDALIARSENDRARFWSYREAVYEFRRILPKGSHFDISIPLSRLAEAVAMLRTRTAALGPDAAFIVFGHVADSNIHVSVRDPAYDAAMGARFEEMVYGIVAELGGSISAEHGIGVLKRPHLGKSRSAPEIEVMRQIKQTLDPGNILNPGRVLPRGERV